MVKSRKMRAASARVAPRKCTVHTESAFLMNLWRSLSCGIAPWASHGDFGLSHEASAKNTSHPEHQITSSSKLPFRQHQNWQNLSLSAILSQQIMRMVVSQADQKCAPLKDAAYSYHDLSGTCRSALRIKQCLLLIAGWK